MTTFLAFPIELQLLLCRWMPFVQFKCVYRGGRQLDMILHHHYRQVWGEFMRRLKHFGMDFLGGAFFPHSKTWLEFNHLPLSFELTRDTSSDMFCDHSLPLSMTMHMSKRDVVSPFVMPEPATLPVNTIGLAHLPHLYGTYNTPTQISSVHSSNMLAPTCPISILTTLSMPSSISTSLSMMSMVVDPIPSSISTLVTLPQMNLKFMIGSNSVPLTGILPATLLPPIMGKILLSDSDTSTMRQETLAHMLAYWMRFVTKTTQQPHACGHMCLSRSNTVPLTNQPPNNHLDTNEKPSPPPSVSTYSVAWSQEWNEGTVCFYQNVWSNDAQKEIMYDYVTKRITTIRRGMAMDKMLQKPDLFGTILKYYRLPHCIAVQHVNMVPYMASDTIMPAITWKMNDLQRHFQHCCRQFIPITPQLKLDPSFLENVIF